MTELERLQAENERLRAGKEWLPNRPRSHERLEERLKRPLLDRLRERQTYTPAENPDGITLDIALYDHDIMEAVAEIERLRALTAWPTNSGTACPGPEELPEAPKVKP